MTKIYVNILQLKKRISPLTGIGLLCLLLVLQGQKSFGQRVYANKQQSGGTCTALGVLCGVVTNETFATDPNLGNYTTLHVPVGALGLAIAWQNLRFTGAVGSVPSLNSPVYFKISPSNGSVLTLLGGFQVQRTQNGTGVGAIYAGNQLLDLLGLFGSTDSTYLFVPPDNNSYSFDGVKLTYGYGALTLFGNAQVYYSFFITTPKISADTQTLCQNALASTLTLTLTNSNETDITYYLYKDDISGLNYSPDAALNTSDPHFVGTFTNHQITITNPFLTMGTGDQTQNYYIIAQDNANSPAFFYSGWKKITFKRTILEAPGLPTATLQ